MPTPASTGAAASTAPAFLRLALNVVGVIGGVIVVIGGVIVASLLLVRGSMATRAPGLQLMLMFCSALFGYMHFV